MKYTFMENFKDKDPEFYDFYSHFIGEEVINDTPLEDQRGIFSKEQTVYTLPVSYYRKVGMIRGRVYKKSVRRIT